MIVWVLTSSWKHTDCVEGLYSTEHSASEAKRQLELLDLDGDCGSHVFPRELDDVPAGIKDLQERVARKS
jgi:hypothetical protein